MCMPICDQFKKVHSQQKGLKAYAKKINYLIQ